MAKFARIVDGVVMETYEGDELFPMAPDYAAQWQQVPNEVDQHWREDGEQIIPPPPEKDYSLLLNAQSALAASDVTLLRAFEEEKTIPKEWVTYRQELRKVIRGESKTLPNRPPYP